MSTLSRSLKVAVTYKQLSSELILYLVFVMIFAPIGALTALFLVTSDFAAKFATQDPAVLVVITLTLGAAIAIPAFLVTLRVRIIMRNRLLRKILESDYGYTNVRLKNNHFRAQARDGSTTVATMAHLKYELIWNKVRETVLIVPYE
jgi:hypothetical protein